MSGISIRQRIALELHRQLVKDMQEKHPLRQLFWESTLRCNMKCRHCGSDCKVSAVHPDMPFEDFRNVLVRIKEKYDSHKIMVIVSGGEPLMRDDLLKCGRAIYDLEFPWGMVSNGRLMTPKKIDQLLASGLHSATISLDGFEDQHNWMRGVPDGFKYASQAVEILAKEPSIMFDVVTCANNRNYDSLEQFKEYLISLGLKSWRIFTVFPVGRAAHDPELQLSKERFRGLMEFIRKTRKEGRIKVSYGCEGFLGEFEGEVRDHLYTCQAGTSIASVLIDGSISACGSIRADYHQGNIYKDDFIDVWENRFQPYRDRSWMKKDKCGDCKWFRYCEGNGMHLRDDDGNLILCHYERIG
ncbi:MAG: TIGR04133 family radical SAM/SPASM protein [Bacteroidales bacterium]|nr:TIGR04133 family radical SAM/SPASM protein [Bacteroidales bacterium]MBQ8810086.1 TIGR04133 family radical SAM/SPASM protein [Bacteroidales bacterium]